MNSNTPTPETDYAFEGDLSVGVNPEITTWQQAKEYARKLERERDELKRKYGYTYCAYCGESFEIDAPASVDAISIHIKHCNKHPMRSVEAERDKLKQELEFVLQAKGRISNSLIKAEIERDQLRKVCALQSEMIKWYVKEFGMPRWGFEFDKLKAIDSLYHQLPHVKEKNK